MKFNLKTTSLVMAACLMSGSLLAQTPDKPESWTLQNCVEYAKAHNLTVKRQELNVLGQEAGLKQAKFSQLPSANFNTSAGQNFGLSLNPATNDFESNSFLSGSLGANSSVTVFNGFRLRNTIMQQKAEVEASRYALEKAKNDISLNVVNAYLNVVFNQELLDNAKFQLESTKKQLERTEVLAEAGSLPISSVLELKAQKANLEFRVVNAENSLTMAYLDLKQMLQLPSEEPIEIERPEIGVQQKNLGDVQPEMVFSQAVRVQPEIKGADARLKSAKFGLKAAKGSYSPRLSIFAGMDSRWARVETNIPTGGEEVVSQSQDVVINGTPSTITYTQAVPSTETKVMPYGEQLKNNFGQNVGVSLSVPIFNGLQARTDVQRANINLQQAELNSREQKMQLRQVIERAYNDALAASKNYEAATVQVEALEEAFRVMEERHAMGAANSVEYLVASNNLNQAKSDLLRAKFDYIFKVKLLDFYQGNPLFK